MSGKIYHIKNPRLPQYRFEWHPATQRVYLVRLGSTPEIGEVVAFHAENEAQATNAVLVWCRGFYEGRQPEPKPHLAI